MGGLRHSLGGNEQLPFLALLHQLHGLGPALDDLVGCKRCWLTTLVRAVELLAINEVAATEARGVREGWDGIRVLRWGSVSAVVDRSERGLWVSGVSASR